MMPLGGASPAGEAGAMGTRWCSRTRLVLLTVLFLTAALSVGRGEQQSRAVPEDAVPNDEFPAAIVIALLKAE